MRHLNLLRTVAGAMLFVVSRTVFAFSPWVVKRAWTVDSRGRRRRLVCGVSSSSSSYVTLEPGSSYSSEMEVKKSRFIAYAQHSEHFADAKNYIEQIRAEHPKARHWCFGFRSLSGGKEEERSSDDGEPTGTAGAPILGAIKGEGISDTVCVVVRYFGGIKLGAGGLIRAYGGAARQVLREAPKQRREPQLRFRVTVPVSSTGALYDAVCRTKGSTTSDETYHADGNLSVTIACAVHNVQRLQDTLRDTTRGNISFATIENES